MSALRQRVVSIARRALSRKRFFFLGKRYRFDCSGFVSYVYAHLGFRLVGDGVPGRTSNGVFRIYRVTRYLRGFHRRKVPCVGDLIFWNYTYDANRDGRLNDRWTHIGIVEGVARDGTIAYIHKGAKTGVSRGRMNLFWPGRARSSQGRVINSAVRHARYGIHLAAGLWAGFGTVLRRPLAPHLRLPSRGVPVGGTAPGGSLLRCSLARSGAR